VKLSLATVSGDLTLSVHYSASIRRSDNYLSPTRALHCARSLWGFGASKYLTHNGCGVPANEAISRHIFQNNRTSGNNCTFANRYSRENQAANCNPGSRANEDGRNLELEIFPAKIVARRTKKGPSGHANIRFNYDLRHAENPNIVADPDMVAHYQAPWKGDIYIAANAYSLPNLRTKRAE